MSFYRDQLEKWLGQISVHAGRVLDVGGLANPVKGRTGEWEVGEYKIMDNGAESYSRPDYFNDINALVDIPGDFDVVFCLEVFEYVYDPVQAIENLGGFLKQGGLLYASFPAVYPVHEPVGIDYLRYTKKAVEKLLAMGGFKTWEITPRVATRGLGSLGKFYQEEAMHPAKDKVIYDIGYMVKAWKT